jgi:beta-alanine degradation protein BauB
MEPRVVEPEVQVDNDETRVVRWTLAPGTAIGHHRHELPYLVVPVIGGTLTFTRDGNDTPVELVPGEAQFRPAGIEHDVANRSTATVAFIEVEFKSRPGQGDP